MDYPELLPCPFCGSAPELKNLAGYEIHCRCGVNYVNDPDKDECVKGWNTRAQRAAPGVQGGEVPPATPVDTAPMYRALQEARLALIPVHSGASIKAIALIDKVLNTIPAAQQTPPAAVDGRLTLRPYGPPLKLRY